MGIRNRDGIWWYRIYSDGVELESRSTGLDAVDSNLKEARAQHDRRKAELLASTARVGHDVRFDVAAADFVQWCYDVEYRARVTTARRIDISMRSLVVHFGRLVVADITAADVEAFKTWRATVHQVRDVTIRHDLHNLNLFFRYARKQQWCGSSPVDEVKIPSDRDSVRMHVITADEERAYFAAAKKTRTLYDVAKLILNQGCRPEEVLCLRAADVNLTAGTLTIQGGKTRAARRSLPLTGESSRILSRRMKPGQDGAAVEWLFPSGRSGAGHVVKLNAQHDRACLDAGVSFVLYDFRHTFASRLADAGEPVPTIAALLGHSGLRVVSRYVHPSEAAKGESMRNYERLMARPRLRRVK